MTLISPDCPDVDTRLATIDHPVARAAFERWMLRFIGAHSRFPVLDAALLAWQWGMRVGLDTLMKSGEKDWVRYPMPGTLAEWAADGGVVDPDTLALLLPGEDGTRQYHVLYDTLTVDEDDNGTIRWYPEAQPRELPLRSPGYGDFAEELNYRKRVMLSHLWHTGVGLEWAEDTGGARSQVVHLEDGTRRLLINQNLEGWDVMSLVLRHLAEHLCAELSGEAEATALEEGLAGELASLRLSVGSTYVNLEAWEYFKEDTTRPSDPSTRWWLILAVAQEIESALLGELGVGEPETSEEAPLPVDIHRTPLQSVDQLVALLPIEDEGLVTGWVDEFVRRNPRFGVEQAVSLAWQLWERVGTAFLAERGARAGLVDADLRTTDDWSARGCGARAGARPLLVPGSHGGMAVYYLAEDVEVVDLAVALEADRFLAEEPDHVHRHRALREILPELSDLHGLVSVYELELLHNIIDMIDLPLVATGERGHVRVAMEELASRFMSGEDILGTSLEEELAVLIAAERLGLEEEPLSPDAVDFHDHSINPQGVRWGLVYRVTRTMEAVLRGYPSESML